MSYFKAEPQRVGEDIQAEIENRMLSGDSFTYGDLCALFYQNHGFECDRAIDRTIQKLRKKGKIAFERKGGRVVWAATKGEKS